MTNLEIALGYLDKGLSFIPLWSPAILKKSPPQKFREQVNKALEKNAKEENPLSKADIFKKQVINKCKEPIIPSWTDYQKRLPTKNEIISWFEENPQANIAIVTGRLSNIVVFDFDSKKAIEYAQNRGGFPTTSIAETGKGLHVYVKYPEFEVRNSSNRDLGLDIRAEGGYVVAPPSEHGSGRVYAWKKGLSICETTPAECAPWMIEYLQNGAKTSKPSTKQQNASLKNTVNDDGEKTKGKNEYLDILKNGCKEGERNHTATRLIGHLLKTDMKAEELWEMIKMWNKRNSPPMDESELHKTFASVKKLESKNRQEEVSVASFLENTKKIVSEYDQNYLRISFGGDSLIALEKKMNGGLVGGRFYLLGGIPSSGKTLMLNNIADNICLNGHPVLFFSYDDGQSELRYRTFARFSGNSIEDFNTNALSRQDIETLCAVPTIKKIRDLKYVVQAMINVEKWEKFIEEIKGRHKQAPVILIDYLRKLRTENKTSEERLRVDDIVSKLTDLAKTHNIPIVAISELARDSYKSGQRLGMASFKESGTIEYEASWLGILAAVEEKENGYDLKKNWEKIIQHDGNIDLIVFKAKRGTGVTGKIPLKTDKTTMTVTDRDDQPRLDTTTKIKQSKFG